MIIYNITVKVDWSVAEEWVEWMRDVHVPAVLNTGCFEKHQLVRLLQTDETDGPTYASQYYTATLSKYDYYLQHHSKLFQQEIREKWGDKYLDFASLMQVVE